MSGHRYMGPREVQSLILGQWVNIVGKHHHKDDDDGDDRGKYGRDQRQQQQQQQQQPPWQQQYQQPWQQPWDQQYQQPWQQQQQYQQPWQQQYQQPYQQPYPQQPLPASAYRQPLRGGNVHGAGRRVTPGRRGSGALHGVEDVLSAPGRAVASIFGELGPAPQYQIPPRNALIQDPGPGRAGREVLPMSTGVAILPTQSAQITARPQRVAFRPERVFISAAGTSGGAADWVVNDIKIGNRSQFSQSGDVPGDMFATNAIDGFVSFETAQTAMDVVMVVTYIGLNESGVPFFASIVGTAAI